MDRQTLPRIEQARITIERLSFEAIEAAIKEFRDAGVPEDTKVTFHQWKMPETNWYMTATWSDDDVVQPENAF